MAKQANGAGSQSKGAFTAKDCGLGSKPNGTKFMRPWTSVSRSTSRDSAMYEGSRTADRDGNTMSNANDQFPYNSKAMSTKHIPMTQGRLSTEKVILKSGSTKGLINPEGRVGSYCGSFESGIPGPAHKR